VNETGWLACTDPPLMLDFLSRHGQLSERTARLFGISVCRCSCLVTDAHDQEVTPESGSMSDRPNQLRGQLTFAFSGRRAPAESEANRWAASLQGYPTSLLPSGRRSARTR
jgi:hypothetical protein